MPAEVFKIFRNILDTLAVVPDNVFEENPNYAAPVAQASNSCFPHMEIISKVTICF